MSATRLIGLLLLTLCSIAAHGAGLDSRYKARVGDLNGDGLDDIYLRYAPKITTVDMDGISIPIPVTRSAYNEILLQRTASGFALLTSLTPAQRTAVLLWPAANLRFYSKDYNGDGDTDLAVLNVGAISSGAEDLVISAPHGGTPAAVLSGVTAQTYYMRYGDINGDGLRDVFVTGNSTRAVGDFILQQQGNLRFTIVNPTPSQVATANSWPIANSGVYREDLNLDGHFDFILEDISEFISNAPDLVVFTTRSQGTVPVKVVHVDAAFKQSMEQIEHFLLKTYETLLGLNQQQCYSIDVPIFSTNWAPSGGPPWNGFWDDRRQRTYTSVTFLPYSYCTSSIFGFMPTTQRLLNYSTQFTALGLGCTNNCGEGTRQTARNAGYTVATEATALRVATWAFRLTAILVADDASGIGAVDDLLIPVTAAVAGGALVVYSVQNAGTQAQDTDVGPTANSYTEVTTGDPFQLGPDCQPNDPVRSSTQVLSGTGSTSSKRLGDNLTKMGCAKPHPDAQAHHIVRQSANNPAVIQTQALLRNLGIDMDEAANGVWLPRGQNVLTQARAHLGDGMHSFEYDQAVSLRLQQATIRGGGSGPGAAQAVRNELEVIRNELLNNTFMF